MFDVEGYIAALKKEEGIWCPSCGREYDDEGDCVSLSGSDGSPTDVQCASCGVDFLVYESVRRTYKTEQSGPPSDTSQEKHG